MLKYTTTEAIARRLRGRLQIGTVQAPYGATVVVDELLEQVGAQVEAQIDAILREVYKYPLNAEAEDNTQSRPILAAIVEKGVICELADVHFYQGEDGNSYGREMCKQYKAALDALRIGNPQLPGEVVKQVTELGGSFTGAGIRVPGIAEAIEW
jgi:hypothetical protein